MRNYYNEAPQFVKKFVDETIRVEGGYVNDPSDSGGETCYGVTIAKAKEFQHWWKDYNWDGEMSEMPIQFAQDLYVEDFYNSPNFCLVAEYSELLAKELFDSGVNMGTGRPSRWLQELLNVFNYNGKYYSDIGVDGRIGKGTCKALKAFLDKRGEEGEQLLYNCLNIEQGHFYIDLAQRREKDEKYIWGWMKNRTEFEEV